PSAGPPGIRSDSGSTFARRRSGSSCASCASSIRRAPATDGLESDPRFELRASMRVTRPLLAVMLTIGLLAAPLAAPAQKGIPIGGFFCGSSATPFSPFVAAFRLGMKEAGQVEGTNGAIDFRWAEGVYGRMPMLVSDPLGRPVAVAVAVGGNGTALAAKAVT